MRKVQGDCRLQTAARCEQLLVLCTVNNSGKRLLRNGRRAPAQSSAGSAECPLSIFGMDGIDDLLLHSATTVESKLPALTSRSFNII
jgi:hypothetical protein